MAITTAYSGSARLEVKLRCAYSGERGGGESADFLLSAALAAAGGDDPTLSGFVQGTLVAAAGDLLLAHATDPLQAMGSARYSEGFTVAGSKLKLLVIRNNDPTNSVTIIRGAANGLPIFLAAGDGVTLGPGQVLFLYNPAGLTAALTTGSNDKLTVSVSAGTPSCDFLAAYGP